MRYAEAKTVEEYLAVLPEDRRTDIEAVRKVILKNLPKGYQEAYNWGMLTYEIPLTRYPDTYHKQPIGIAALASQKNYMSIYLMNVYGNKETHDWFMSEWEKTGKKLDMGKSCVRFKKIEDLPLELIGKVIARTSVDDYIKVYENSRHFKK